MYVANANLAIEIGTRVYSGLYGGRHGIVYASEGQQSPETCKSFGGFVSAGGNARFDIVFDNGSTSRAIPECIIRGVQWKIFESVADANEIACALAHAATVNAQRMADELSAKSAFETECIRIKSAPEYSHLIQTSAADRNQLAKNLRADLKKHFPGIKFSVRNTHGSSYSIRWTDGPTDRAVNESVVGKFKAGSFNGMEDIYEYSNCPFTEIFGDAKYIFTNRDYSEILVGKAIANLKEKYAGNFAEMEYVPTASEYLDGKTGRVQVPHLGYEFSELVGKALQKLTA